MNTKTILTPYFLDHPLLGLEEVAEPDWVVNYQSLPKADVLVRMATLHGVIAREVEAALQEGQLPISIAGDCCTAVGVLAGILRSSIEPLLIWFDAHGDFNTWETTPSGFLGGMPLAMIAGLGDQTLLDLLKIDPLAQQSIILTDGRDLDPGEEVLIKESSITHFKNPQDLMDYDYKELPIWVHFDTDIVNSEQSPAQNYPAPGGPNQEDLDKVFHHLAQTGLIKVVSLSSWAPDLEGSDKSKRISLDLLEVLCGQG